MKKRLFSGWFQKLAGKQACCSVVNSAQPHISEGWIQRNSIEYTGNIKRKRRLQEIK